MNVLMSSNFRSFYLVNRTPVFPCRFSDFSDFSEPTEPTVAD